MSESLLLPLSITLTGQRPLGDGEPLAVYLTDAPIPDLFDHFSLAERGAFRALCQAAIDSLDGRESREAGA